MKNSKEIPLDSSSEEKKEIPEEVPNSEDVEIVLESDVILSDLCPPEEKLKLKPYPGIVEIDSLENVSAKCNSPNAVLIDLSRDDANEKLKMKLRSTPIKSISERESKNTPDQFVFHNLNQSCTDVILIDDSDDIIPSSQDSAANNTDRKISSSKATKPSVSEASDKVVVEESEIVVPDKLLNTTCDLNKTLDISIDIGCHEQLHTSNLKNESFCCDQVTKIVENSMNLATEAFASELVSDDVLHLIKNVVNDVKSCDQLKTSETICDRIADEDAPDTRMKEATSNKIQKPDSNENKDVPSEIVEMTSNDHQSDNEEISKNSKKHNFRSMKKKIKKAKYSKKAKAFASTKQLKKAAIKIKSDASSQIKSNASSQIKLDASISASNAIQTKLVFSENSLSLDSSILPASSQSRLKTSTLQLEGIQKVKHGTKNKKTKLQISSIKQDSLTKGDKLDHIAVTETYSVESKSITIASLDNSVVITEENTNQQSPRTEMLQKSNTSKNRQFSLSRSPRKADITSTDISTSGKPTKALKSPIKNNLVAESSTATPKKTVAKKTLSSSNESQAGKISSSANKGSSQSTSDVPETLEDFINEINSFKMGHEKKADEINKSSVPNAELCNSKENVKQVTLESPKENVKQDYLEIPKKNVKQVTLESPKETVTQVTLESPKKTVKQVTLERPKENVKQVTLESPKLKNLRSVQKKSKPSSFDVESDADNAGDKAVSAMFVTRTSKRKSDVNSKCKSELINDTDNIKERCNVKKINEDEKRGKDVNSVPSSQTENQVQCEERIPPTQESDHSIKSSTCKKSSTNDSLPELNKETEHIKLSTNEIKLGFQQIPVSISFSDSHSIQDSKWQEDSTTRIEESNGKSREASKAQSIFLKKEKFDTPVSVRSPVLLRQRKLGISSSTKFHEKKDMHEKQKKICKSKLVNKSYSTVENVQHSKSEDHQNILQNISSENLQDGINKAASVTKSCQGCLKSPEKPAQSSEGERKNEIIESKAMASSVVMYPDSPVSANRRSRMKKRNLDSDCFSPSSKRRKVSVAEPLIEEGVNVNQVNSASRELVSCLKKIIKLREQNNSCETNESKQLSLNGTCTDGVHCGTDDEEEVPLKKTRVEILHEETTDSSISTESSQGNSTRLTQTQPSSSCSIIPENLQHTASVVVNQINTIYKRMYEPSLGRYIFVSTNDEKQYIDYSKDEDCQSSSEKLPIAPCLMLYNTQGSFTQMKPVAFFYDVENLMIRKNFLASDVVEELRARFIKNNNFEHQFVVVMDTRKEQSRFIDEFILVNADVYHIYACAKNAADEKLKNLMIRFSDTFGSLATIVLISDDVNYAPTISYLKLRKGSKIILVNSGHCNRALILPCAEHYIFEHFFDNSCNGDAQSFVIASYTPFGEITPRLKDDLRNLIDNCGGKILLMNIDSALIMYKSCTAGNRGKKRLHGEYLRTHEIETIFIHSNKLRKFLSEVIEIQLGNQICFETFNEYNYARNMFFFSEEFLRKIISTAFMDCFSVISIAGKTFIQLLQGA